MIITKSSFSEINSLYKNKTEKKFPLTSPDSVLSKSTVIELHILFEININTNSVLSVISLNSILKFNFESNQFKRTLFNIHFKLIFFLRKKRKPSTLINFTTRKETHWRR